jgi:hypothetical protein
LIGLFFNYFICSRLKFINSVELYLWLYLHLFLLYAPNRLLK